MTKPVVFVIGASGQMGSSAVMALSAKYTDQVEIRAGVRNPDRADKLKSLAGVTVVQATMGDEKLEQVLSGVNALYIVTPPTDRVYLTTSTAELAKKAGVKHIAVVTGVVSALPDTIIGADLAEIEKKVVELGVPYTFVCFAFFMENIWQYKDTIVNQGVFYGPVDPEKPFMMTSVKDAGKAVAAILVNPSSHANKSVNLVSDKVSNKELALTLSAALGKEVSYIRTPYEATRKSLLEFGMPQKVVDGLLETYKMIDASHPLQSEGDVGIITALTGDPPTDLKKWVAKYAGGFQ